VAPDQLLSAAEGVAADMRWAERLANMRGVPPRTVITALRKIVDMKARILEMTRVCEVEPDEFEVASVLAAQITAALEGAGVDGEERRRVADALQHIVRGLRTFAWGRKVAMRGFGALVGACDRAQGCVWLSSQVGHPRGGLCAAARAPGVRGVRRMPPNWPLDARRARFRGGDRGREGAGNHQTAPAGP